jgi:hypothetical protein
MTYGANTAGAAAASKEPRNRPYGDAVSYAGYFYMDNFAVLVRFCLAL